MEIKYQHDLKIQSFGFTNYRSIDESGFQLKNLNKINVFIGKNNSGKSNMLRFLKTLSENYQDLSKFPNDINNQYKRNGKSARMLFEIKGEDLIIGEKGRRNRERYDAFIESTHVFEYDLVENTVLNIEEVFSDFKNRDDVMPFQSRYTGGGYHDLIKEVEKRLMLGFISFIKGNFSDVIYIPHLRIIKEGHKFGDSNSRLDGSNIISKMFEMNNPRVGDEKERDKFDKIQNFVRKLLNNNKIIIEIPHDKKEIILTYNGNRLPLEYYGTGIHQLVILCSALVIHDDSVVCIEEPEIHLHPELQRKFIRFLDQETNNVYFITTHSNVFLEENNNTSIYHIDHDGERSHIQYCNTTSKSYQILNSLGYKASDILQSNGVIWVEGPSDRTFINKWISLLDEKLKEGIHYSIMFYGGRLLSNVSFSNEEISKELVPLLKINKNAYVVMDRDGFNSEVEINKTKKRIAREVGERNYWVTKGKEIENYLHEDVLNSWLNTSKFINNENKKLGDLVKRVSKQIKYDSKKSHYALEIIDHINIDSLNILDLKKQVNSLVRSIHSWNNI